MRCRHCQTELQYTFLDLGFAPPSNSYLSKEDLQRPETYYPLKIKVCDQCWLVQTEDYAEADELFTSDYAYFSSTSSSWLVHAQEYSQKILTQLGLTNESFVIEIASNDGYLLRNFVDSGIPCLGIEPTESTAKASEDLGIQVLREFFGENLGARLASENRKADLIIGNNVYAHVPDINDFTKGLKRVLKPGGTITLEFPHFLRLLENNQFDTIYHEHFSYLSLYTVNRIFSSFGLRIWNVEELQTHGGSLRIYGCHHNDARETEQIVSNLLQEEIDKGLCEVQTYITFQPKSDKIKDDLLTFLIDQKRKGKTVVAFGAAAKGNTLLNYAGVKPDLVPFVFDAAKSKQGMFMPGSHIPILNPELLPSKKPDFILILPWNLSHEIKSKVAALYHHDVKFVTLIPKLSIT